MATPYGSGPPPGWQAPGPQQPYQQSQYSPPAGPRTDSTRGFFGSLFDFSFDNFIAPKLVKFLYVLLLILLTIGALVQVVGSFGMIASGQDGFVLLGLLWLVLAPVFWFLGLMIYRVMLELMIVIFKISEDLKDIRDSRTLR